MKFLGNLSVLLAVLLFVSCEKEINVPLEQGETRLVVEGSIANDQPPFVTLTKSVGFFDKIDFNNINYVSGAIVTVTDLTANQSIVLKEYTIDSTIGGNTFSFKIYGPDTAQANWLNFVSGKIGHFYQLDIVSDGKNYRANTQLPNNAGLDSIWLEPAPIAPDSFILLKVIYDDPDTIGNSARYQTLRRSIVKEGQESYLKSFSPNFDDEIINAQRFPFIMDLGVNRNDPNLDFQRATLVKKGDTITIQWSSIDKAVYTFWNTFDFSQGSVGNPFASPTQVQSNISNGALGVWAGYTNDYKTIIDSL
jgi:hypothetical protein